MDLSKHARYILSKLRNENLSPPDNSWHSLKVVTLASSQVPADRILTMARELEGVYVKREEQKRLAAGEDYMPAEPPAVVQYRVVDKNGVEHLWSGYGQAPKSFEKALLEMGLSIKDCKVSEL
ncbi:hypothetical protein C9975_11590, partial [Thalassospira xiamenensis]